MSYPLNQAPVTEGSLPTGVVTLVFTDIVDSSALSERHGAAFEGCRAAHYAILRAHLAEHRGREVHTAGDSLFSVFPHPADAIYWAVAVQRALLDYPWPAQIGPVRVRLGMYTGEPILADNNGRPDYFGPVPNRAARVAAAAHGGQILVTETTRALAGSEIQKTGFVLEYLGTHRLKGMGEERLYQVRADGIPSQFPSPVSLGAARHNLPLPQTPFFEREEHTAALCALLNGGKRLVTIVGMGGMGKTRIALQTAEICLDAFPSGAWWCDLTEARNADAMLQKLAFDLDLEMQPPPSARERIMGWLREQKRVLLVLDNLEQIAGAETVVRDLIAVSSEVACLITSRRRFGLQAETVYELPPLSLESAAAFFIERAHARQSDFALTAENAADIAALCRQLEGVPLALELAAARIATMTPRKMVSLLGERFRLLQTRAPDLPERQRGLRAAIDWSYDLLDDEMRSIFAQLSVFSRTGFTLDDADAVCEGFDVLDSVTFLREHSLLQTETETSSQVTRFYLLESLRAYASDRLSEGPETEAAEVRARHARHFLSLAEKRLVLLRTPAEAEGLTEMERVVDDLRSAQAWTGGSGKYPGGLAHPDLHARLCLALGTLLFRRGFLPGARKYYDAGLTTAASAGTTKIPPRLHISLLRASAGLLIDLRQLEGARQQIEAARRLESEADSDPPDREGEAEEMNLLGHIALAEGDFMAARSRFQRGLDRVTEASGSPVWTALLLNNLGLTELKDADGGDFEAGKALLIRALEIRRSTGDKRGTASTLNNLGTSAFLAEQWKEAADYYAESLTYELALNHALGVALALNNHGEAVEAFGTPEIALRCFTAAAHLFQEGGSPLHEIASAQFQRLAAQQSLSPSETAALQSQSQGKNLEDLCFWALPENMTRQRI